MVKDFHEEMELCGQGIREIWAAIKKLEEKAFGSGQKHDWEKAPALSVAGKIPESTGAARP